MKRLKIGEIMFFLHEPEDPEDPFEAVEVPNMFYGLAGTQNQRRLCQSPSISGWKKDSGDAFKIFAKVCEVYRERSESTSE